METLLKVPKPKQARFGFFKSFGIGKEKEAFVENLSLMIAADIPVAQALEAVKADIVSKKLLKIVEVLENDINSGQHFWQAFAKAELFPEYIISLIRIGEETGRLSENLKVISEQQQKDRIFKQRIQSAMIYPAIVFGLTITIGIGIAWFILPRLASVFLNLRLKLPLPTRMLIAFGSFLQHWGIVAVPIFIVAFGFIFYFLFFNPKTKFLGQKLLFFIPPIRSLVQEVELARFSYVLGSLLGAGVPVVEAVDLSSKASTFENYKKFLAKLKNSLEEGNSFQNCFHNFQGSKKLIPLAIQQLIISAEKSGRLEEVLLSVSKKYEEKSETTTKNLTVILEPIMLVVVWGGVVLVALAVILPIYNLIGGLQGSTEPVPQPAVIRKSAPPLPKPAIVVPGNNNLATSTANSTLPIVKGDATVNPGGRIKVAGNLTYLYVRNQPKKTAKVVAKIYPGELYSYNKEKFLNGATWFYVRLSNGDKGWISGQFAEIVRNSP